MRTTNVTKILITNNVSSGYIVSVKERKVKGKGFRKKRICCGIGRFTVKFRHKIKTNGDIILENFA